MGDGIGDNEDTDDDNDGMPDEDEYVLIQQAMMKNDGLGLNSPILTLVKAQSIIKKWHKRSPIAQRLC